MKPLLIVPSREARVIWGHAQRGLRPRSDTLDASVLIVVTVVGSQSSVLAVKDVRL